jgi:hypothetical protein
VNSGGIGRKLGVGERLRSRSIGEGVVIEFATHHSTMIRITTHITHICRADLREIDEKRITIQIMCKACN